MADGDIGTVQDTLLYDGAWGDFNRIIRCYNHIALIVYQFTGGDIGLKTVEVDAAGEITDTVKDTLSKAEISAQFFSVCERTPGIYIVTLRGYTNYSHYYLWIFSVSVGSAGALPADFLDNIHINNVLADITEVCHLTGDIMVAVCTTSGPKADLYTFTCNSAGSLGASYEDHYQYEATFGYRTSLCKISNSVVATVTRITADHGELKTFHISATGTITTPEVDSIEFEATHCDYPKVVNVIGDIYAIVYTDGSGHGICKTVEIDSNGNLVGGILSTYEFESDTFYDPQVIKLDDGIIAVVYTGADSDGFIVTLGIGAAGAITTPFLDKYEYDTDFSNRQDLALMAGDIILVPHKNAATFGEVHSIDVELPAAEAPHHEMVMGMGP